MEGGSLSCGRVKMWEGGPSLAVGLRCGRRPLEVGLQCRSGGPSLAVGLRWSGRSPSFAEGSGSGKIVSPCSLAKER